MKEAKKTPAKYANRNTQDVNFERGDPVYYRNTGQACQKIASLLPHNCKEKSIDICEFKVS